MNLSTKLTGEPRKRKFFETKREGEDWVDDFMEKLRIGGVKSALKGEGQTVRAAWGKFYEAKEPDASPSESATLRVYGKHINEAFGPFPLNLVTAVTVDRWLKSKGWSKRTRYNAFTYLRTFMRWCHRRGMVDVVDIEVLGDEVHRPPAPKAIIGPAEMEILLDLTKDDHEMRAAFVLGGFAGIRTKEILLMEWRHCDFEAGEIHITKEIIKATEGKGGMRERYVKMLPSFLRHIPKDNVGPIISVGSKGFRGRRAKYLPAIRVALKKKGLLDDEKWREWPNNCLRHSFASALLATTKDAWKTAHELGHTNTKTIHQDYARAMKEKEALAFFDL